MRNIFIASVLGLMSVMSVGCCHRDPCPNTVQQPGTSYDAAITTKIKAYALVHKNVSVTTNNGVVTLKGTVATQTEKDNLICYAKSVKGVRKIVDQIAVVPNK